LVGEPYFTAGVPIGVDRKGAGDARLQRREQRVMSG